MLSVSSKLSVSSEHDEDSADFLVGGVDEDDSADYVVEVPMRIIICTILLVNNVWHNSLKYIKISQ